MLKITTAKGLPCRILRACVVYVGAHALRRHLMVMVLCSHDGKARPKDYGNTSEGQTHPVLVSLGLRFDKIGCPKTHRGPSHSRGPPFRQLPASRVQGTSSTQRFFNHKTCDGAKSNNRLLSTFYLGYFRHDAPNTFPRFMEPAK